MLLEAFLLALNFVSCFGQGTQDHASTAFSVCDPSYGYTPQYLDFNPLLSKYSSRGFHMLCFPSNQFHLQEPGKNYELLNGLKYVRPGGGWEPSENLTIHAKLDVNGENAHPMFRMLREACPQTVSSLGKREFMFYDPINTNDIVWNFEKFIIDREGRPRFRFHPAAWGNKGDFVEKRLRSVFDGAANLVPHEENPVVDFFKIFPFWPNQLQTAGRES